MVIVPQGKQSHPRGRLTPNAVRPGAIRIALFRPGFDLPEDFANHNSSDRCFQVFINPINNHIELEGWKGNYGFR